MSMAWVSGCRRYMSESTKVMFAVIVVRGGCPVEMRMEVFLT